MGVMYLSSTHKPLRERLADTYGYRLVHVHAEALPTDEDRQILKDLLGALTATGTIAEDLGSMTDEEVSECARKVVRLYDSVAKKLGQ